MIDDIISTEKPLSPLKNRRILIRCDKRKKDKPITNERPKIDSPIRLSGIRIKPI